MKGLLLLACGEGQQVSDQVPQVGSMSAQALGTVVALQQSATHCDGVSARRIQGDCRQEDYQCLSGDERPAVVDHRSAACRGDSCLPVLACGVGLC